MLRTPKFEGGIFSACNQTDFRKYICWRTGINVFAVFILQLPQPSGDRGSLSPILLSVRAFKSAEWDRQMGCFPSHSKSGSNILKL